MPTSNRNRVLAYLGPPGSHSHQAARQVRQVLATDFELAAHPSLTALMRAAAETAGLYAVLPVENLLEGSVSEVLQGLGLKRYPLQAWAEWRVPVRHRLLTRGTGGEIQAVMSHPQALGQCRETLARLYGEGLRLQASASTSEAARLLGEGCLPEGTAVIASPMAGALYGLQVREPDIADVADNVTRFWLAGQVRLEGELVPGPLKTSICLAFPDRPGALLEALQPFREAGINLSRIESRPSRKRLGEYVFYLDAEGDLSRQTALLARLEALTAYCHRLGPYVDLGLLSGGD